MTIKLLLLKSGEDIISDVSEMCVGDAENRRIIGYFLDKPCVVKMRNPNLISEKESGTDKKTGFQVSLFPWMPLSEDEKISIPADWVVTIVEPIRKIKEMYLGDVLKDGKETSQNTGTDERSDSDQSD
jgi:hypothetical protein